MSSSQMSGSAVGHRQVAGAQSVAALDSARNRESALPVAGQAAIDGRRVEALQLVVAIGSVLLIGLHSTLYYGVTTAAVPVALLIPVWTSILWRFRGAPSLMILTALALVAGVLLARVSAADHHIDGREAFASITLLATGIGAVGVLLWVSTIIRPDRIALLYGVGMLLGSAASPASWGSDPWKYAFAFPVAIIALSLFQQLRSGIMSLVLLGVLGLVSIVFNYRSFLAFCVLTALLVLWQKARRSPAASRNRFAPLLMMGVIGLGIYYLATSLLVGGFLGATLQQRSIAQIDASGSLLIGGRPEWSATVQLMKMNPWGYGLGATPNMDDLMAGKRGFASINADYNNGYIENYMLGNQFHLHSIIADLWSSCGVVGLVLAVLIVVRLLGSLSVALSASSASAVFVLTTLVAVWDLGFGPIFTNLTDVTLALALAMMLPHLRCGPEADSTASRGPQLTDDWQARA
jgi:hypothetical protein